MKLSVAALLLLNACCYEVVSDEKWSYNQTINLPRPDESSQTPNPDGSSCHELRARDERVSFVAERLGCNYSSECSSMWGAEVRVYVSEPMSEDAARLLVWIGPCDSP